MTASSVRLRPVPVGEALAELLVIWRRRGVRIALRRHDGTLEAERSLVERYDALVDAEERAR